MFLILVPFEIRIFKMGFSSYGSAISIPCSAVAYLLTKCRHVESNIKTDGIIVFHKILINEHGLLKKLRIIKTAYMLTFSKAHART
jgi:hypothetical protein